MNVSHVLFKSAYIHDVAAIAEKARRGRCGHGHRRLSVRGHDPGRRASPGRRRLHRRLPEMALRRPGGGVPLGRSRASRRASARAHRLDVARAALRLRARGWTGATTPGGSSTARRTSRPSTRPGRAWRSSAGSASRPSARSRSARRPGCSSWPNDAWLPRAPRRASPTARGDGRHRGRARLRDLPGSQGPATSSAIIAPAPASASRPTSTPATMSSRPLCEAIAEIQQTGGLAGLHRRAIRRSPEPVQSFERRAVARPLAANFAAVLPGANVSRNLHPVGRRGCRRSGGRKCRGPSPLSRNPPRPPRRPARVVSRTDGTSLTVLAPTG